MDKGKSKIDLRAAGKKRLEEFRQKRQQKGSLTKSSTTSTLKALTESEQSSGEVIVQESFGDVAPLKGEAHGPFEKDGKFELVAEHVDEAADVCEEHHVVISSLVSSVTPTIQKLQVGGCVSIDALEPSVESPCEPGSSNSIGLDDKDREAVYTILWENHGTDHPQRIEEWQERSYDGRVDLDERAPDHGHYSNFLVEGEHYASESKEGLSMQRKLSKNLIEIVDKFHSFEGINEHLNLHEDVEEPNEDRRDVLLVDQCFQANSFMSEGSTEQIIGQEWVEDLEKRADGTASEIAVLLKRLEQIMEESGRERESYENEIVSLKDQIREKNEVVMTRDAQLEELETAKIRAEEKLRIALDSSESQKELINLEFKAQIERMAEEMDKFLSKIDAYEKDSEALTAECAHLTAQAHAMKKSSDDFQRERDVAMFAKSSLREDVDILTTKLHDVNEESITVQALVKELQENLETVKSECIHLNQSIHKVMNGDGEGVKMVAVLEGDKCKLQALNYEFAEKLRAAEVLIQSLLEDQALKMELQQHFEELDDKLQFERATLEKILNGVDLLSNYIEEHVLTMISDHQWTSKSTSAVLQHEYKLALLVEKILPELVLRTRMIEEERDLANQTLLSIKDKTNLLQAERNVLISEMGDLKTEIEAKMAHLINVRVENEGQIKALTSSLEEETKVRVDYEGQTKALTSSLMEATEVRAEYEGQINALTSSLEEETKVRAEFEGQIKALASSLEEETKVRAKYEGQTKALTSSLEEATKVRAEYEGQINALTSSLEEETKVRAEHEGEIKALTSSLEEETKVRAKYEGQTKALTSSLMEATEVRAEYEGQINALTSSLEEETKVRAEFEGQIKALNSSLEEETKVRAKYEGQTKALTSSLEEATKVRAEYEGQINALTSSLEEETKVRAEHEGEIKALTSSLEEETKVRAEYEGQIKVLSYHLEEVTKVRAEYEGEIKVLASRLEEATEVRAEYERQIKALTSSLEEEIKVRVDYEGQFKALTSSLEEAIEVRAEYEGQIKALAYSLEEETKVRAEYEGQVKALTSSLEEAGNEVNVFKNERAKFEKKLFMVVTREFPGYIIQPSERIEATFDFCWNLVDVMLEGTSKKLEDVQRELLHANMELNDMLTLERLQHQSSIVEVEAGKEVMHQENSKLSQKVKLLEEERTRLQEEEERVVHEWQDLLEIETKANLDRQEKIQMLESIMDALRRELEERKVVDVEVRSAHENDVKSLNSMLQSIQSKLSTIRDMHTHFHEKLECVAREVLPTFEVKPSDFEDNHFDYSWAIVGLILEEYSKKLQHAHADVRGLESKMNMGKEDEIRGLQELLQKLTEELAMAKEERDVAQSELAQFEKRLANNKERLTLAINKGKSIVMQRDVVKATLAEKTIELERVVCEHKEMMRLKDITFQEAQTDILSLKAKANLAEALKVELVEAHDTYETLENSLLETKSALNDLEMALENLNLVVDDNPKSGVAKIEMVATKLKDLQGRSSYYEKKAECLIVDLTAVENEKEDVLQKLQKSTSVCKRLEKISDENALDIVALKLEIEVLQKSIAILKIEAAQYMGVQHAISRTMGELDISRLDFEANQASLNLSMGLELDGAVASLVNKYKSAMRELDEVREQSNSLKDVVEKLEEEDAVVSSDKLRSLEATLLTQDTELRGTIEKLEGATKIICEKEEETKGYVEQIEGLNGELVKCKEDLVMLNSKLNIAEEKVLGLVVVLREAVGSFKSSSEEHSFQVEEPLHPLNQLVMEVNSLVKTVLEQRNGRETELHNANERAMVALMQELSATKGFCAKFEQEFLEFKNVAEGVSWLNRSAPSSSSLVDWVTWLIDVLEEEHQMVEQTLREIESLTKIAEGKAVVVQRLQGENNSLLFELSNEQHQNEVAADELRKRDLELKIVEEKVQKLVALELEVESMRSKDHVENALMGLEEVVEGICLQGRPSSTSSPTEWISWLILALQKEQEKFGKVAQEGKTLRSIVDALTHEVEEANDKYSSHCEELSSQKDENKDLQIKLGEANAKFSIERDSLKSEIQLLRDTCVEISSRELEFTKAQRTVTNLQETLSLKDRELFKFHNEIEDLSLRYSQQELKLQSLMEEQQKLSFMLVDVETERDSLRTLMAEAAKEKSTLQSDFEQKLVVVREKLNLAIRKGKGLEKQRELLKQSVVEETTKVEFMVLSHRKETQLKDLELLESRAQVKAMDTRVQELQAEVVSLHKIATSSQQRMQTEHQRLESVFSGIEVSKDVQSKDPLEKVEWLVLLLEGTRNTTKFLEGELDNSRYALETIKSSLRDTEERLRSITIENSKAQETISLWVKKAEEAESRAAFDREGYENEIDGLTRALKEVDLRYQAASNSKNALETLKSLLRDTEERLQFVTVEKSKAEENISMWVRKVEEVESKATFDQEQYKDEIDGLTRALKEAELRYQAASSNAKELENTLEKQQNTLNASEVVHSKTISKLTFTRNKLNLLVQQSQELVRECESLHKSLQERNAEISELKQEIAQLKNIQVELRQSMDAGSEVSSQLMLLQDELVRTNQKSVAIVEELREQLEVAKHIVEEKDFELDSARRKLEDILLKGDNVLRLEHNTMNQNNSDDSLEELGVQSRNLASVTTAIGQRFDNLILDAQTQWNNSEKKEVQLQKMWKELHDLSLEKASLQASVQAKTMQIERLQSEVNTRAVSVGGGSLVQSEIKEVGTRISWVAPSNPATPHVRGPRRPSQAEIAIDVGNEDNSLLLTNMNDKEHGFNALTNSRLVPKATRMLADKFDGMWFAGGRIFTRQPLARLGLAMYWVLIHVYMATMLSRMIL